MLAPLRDFADVATLVPLHDLADVAELVPLPSPKPPRKSEQGGAVAVTPPSEIHEMNEMDDISEVCDFAHVMNDAHVHDE